MTPFDKWKANAKRAAGRLWGYPELIDDDPEAARAAFDAGEDYARYVLELGEELDLIVPDPFTVETLKRLYPLPSDEH
jgi:hypothetical protein